MPLKQGNNNPFIAVHRTQGQKLNSTIDGFDVQLQSSRSINRFSTEFAEHMMTSEIGKPNSFDKFHPNMMQNLVELAEMGSEHHDQLDRYPDAEKFVGDPPKSKPLFALNVHTKTILDDKTQDSSSVAGHSTFISSNNCLQLLPLKDGSGEAIPIKSTTAQSLGIYVTSLTTSKGTCEEMPVPPKMSNYSRKCSIIFFGRE